MNKPPQQAIATARLGRLALFCIVLLLVCLAIGFIPRWRAHQALAAERQDPTAGLPTVLVASPISAPPPAGGVLLPAEIKPFVEAPIYSRANGYLRRWLVDIGDRVQQGQLLAEIDTPELDQELARSQAELAQAQAASALAEISAARWAELLKTASVSEQEAAEKKADLALKSAIVQASEANRHRLEELKSFARVTAPFAGTIAIRRTDIGQLVTAASGRELFRLARTDLLRVQVRVPQSMAPGIAPGQKAAVLLAEFPNREFEAKIVRTSGVLETESRTLLVELELDNAQGSVLAGSYAQVRFSESNQAAALTLPSNTLLFHAEGALVGVVSNDGVVSLRKVRPGRDFGKTVEILTGLTTSDRVILNPMDSLVDGTRVRVATSPNTPAPRKEKEGR